jgi:putative phosphoesterase
VEHQIGIISDTHVPRFRLPIDVVEQHFSAVEMIIHAGDLSTLDVLNTLETIAPVVAVQGNIEEEDVVRTLSLKREVVVGGCRIGVVHILKQEHLARQEFHLARVVLFGHSHTPYNQEYDGQLLFNPGSVTDRRRQPACSLGLLTIDDETGQVQGNIIRL